jgi:hypothetical protein
VALVRAYNHRRETIGQPRPRKLQYVETSQALDDPEDRPPQAVVRIEEMEFGDEIQWDLQGIQIG